MPNDDTSAAHPEENSDISPVEVPKDGFASSIPAYLLEGKSDAEAYVLQEISKMSEFTKWAAPILVDSNLSIRKTNGRVKSLEGWRLKLTTGWGAIAMVIGGLFTLIGAIEGIITVINFLAK